VCVCVCVYVCVCMCVCHTHTHTHQLVGASGRVIGFEPQGVLYQMVIANVALNGTQFTCFTSTQVQILTSEELRVIYQTQVLIVLELPQFTYCTISQVQIM
jgi:hypothetical protein